LFNYTPNLSVFVLPDDTGKFIPKGSKILFEFHYVTTGKKEVDRTELALYIYKKKPAKALYIEQIRNDNFEIPSYTKNHVLSASMIIDKTVLFHRYMPHMHYRGKSMKFIAQYPNGEEEILLSVPNYKFNWQKGYQYKQPKIIPAETKIIVEARYDNSSQNAANPDPSRKINYGPQTTDEMFIGIIFYSLVSGD